MYSAFVIPNNITEKQQSDNQLAMSYDEINILKVFDYNNYVKSCS